MKKIDYERNWCEHFTKCPYFYDKENDEPYVGDYYCSRCRYYMKAQEQEKPEYDPCNYAAYFVNVKGIVFCKFNEEYNETF